MTLKNCFHVTISTYDRHPFLTTSESFPRNEVYCRGIPGFTTTVFVKLRRDKNLKKEKKKRIFRKIFLFPVQLLSARASFQDMLTQMKDTKELAHLLVIDSALIVSSYPDVCTAGFVYLTVPVTVAKAKRSFSKLKLIKNYLHSSVALERLSALALLATEKERAQNISFKKTVDDFASVKSRKMGFE